MTSQTTTNTRTEDKRIFLNGQQLAEVLNISPPSLSQAVKKGRNCQGYPVVEWAIETDTGRIKGYNVPEFLISGDKNQITKPRDNPDQQPPNKANKAPNKSNQTSGLAKLQETYNNYSVLPEGQDYIRPVSMASLSSVLKKAIEQDTPQSRAVIGALLGMLGAITGHAVTDNTTGAGIGAGAGLGIALFIYKYLNPNEYQYDQRTGSHNVNRFDKPTLQKYANRAKKSGYMPN